MLLLRFYRALTINTRKLDYDTLVRIRLMRLFGTIVTAAYFPAIADSIRGRVVGDVATVATVAS